MPLFAKSNVLLIHIPKTAGSSLESLLYAKEEKADQYSMTSFYGGYAHGRLYSQQHYTFVDLESLIPPERMSALKHIVAVVRNPFDRVVSEFYYRNWTIHQAIPDDDIPRLQLMFQQFLVDFLAENKSTDNHSLPQHLFIVNKTGVIEPRITILRFENLQRDIQRTLGHDTSKTFHLKSDRKAACAVHFNQVTTDLVREYYKNDFVLLGYDSEKIPSIPLPPVAQEQKTPTRRNLPSHNTITIAPAVNMTIAPAVNITTAPAVNMTIAPAVMATAPVVVIPSPVPAKRVPRHSPFHRLRVQAPPRLAPVVRTCPAPLARRAPVYQPRSNSNQPTQARVQAFLKRVRL